MSLINQMLRDLEKRRKTDGRQLLSGEKPAVVGAQSSSRRLLYLLAGGVVLVALVWFALEFFPVERFTAQPRIKIVPQDEQSQRIAIIRGRELFAALEEKAVNQPATLETTEGEETSAVAEPANSQAEMAAVKKAAAPPENKLASATSVVKTQGRIKPETTVTTGYQPSARPPVATSAPVDPVTAADTRSQPVQKTQPTVVVGAQESGAAAVVENSGQEKPVPAPILKSRVAAGSFTSTLLNLGVLEAIGSVRLMFEFEQLPEYRWDYSGKDKLQLLVQFKKTAVRQALSIPQLKGPLLKQLTLQPEKDSLQLLINTSKQVKIQALELPADPFHGHRLLVELYLHGSTETVSPAPAVSSVAALTAEKKATKSSTNKVSKNEKSQSAEKQAQQKYQAALELLQRGEYQAAEANLFQALSLQPRLLDARLQLIKLLLRLSNNSKAEKQMEIGLQQHPDHPVLRKLYARHLLSVGQPEGAINVLQSEPRPEVSRDLEYYALLAALQQETGQHKAAVKSYSELLKFRPREALWWMGLAISYDQSQDYSRAKESYQKALSLPGLLPDLQDYIRNRLQGL